jgi:uncharacterized membrane protein HdeD (DUF308 family)
MFDLIFILLVIVGISLGALHATLMLVSPQTHRRFNFWLSTMGRRPKLRLDERDSGKDLELSYRAAGLIILAGLVAFVWVGVSSLMRVHGQPSPSTKGPSEARPTWLPFVVGFAAVAGGIYCIKRPEALYRWSSKAAVRLRQDTSDVARMRRTALLMGLCLIGFGLFALATGFATLLH